MEFGLHSPTERNNPIAATTYDEDLYEITTADRLGFHEAWLAEHVGHTDHPDPDSQPAPDLAICRAAAVTKNIRLGPGVRQLPFYHPLQVAIEAVVCDHLTHGRYMLGVGGGSDSVNGSNQFEQRGLPLGDRRAMMHESIAFLQKALTSTEPFDWDGEFWSGRRIRVVPTPYQKPRMPIAIACSSGTESTLEIAGRNGFIPLFSFNASPAQIRKMGDTIVKSAAEVGQAYSRSNFRVPRFVYLSDSVARAKDHLRDTIEPTIRRRVTRFPDQFASVLPPSGNVEDINFDYLVDAGIYCIGDPDTVYRHVKDLYDETGGFGVLLFVVGKDISTRQRRARSLRLFAQHVAPRLAALNPEKVATAAVS